MRTFFIVPVGIALALTATAANHPLSVHATLVHSPCSVNLPELIDMGDIPAPTDSTVWTSRVQTKAVTGTVTCSAPVRLNIRLSPSSGTNYITRFHQNNISGSLQVILANDPLTPAPQSYPGNSLYTTTEQSRLQKNWPVTLLVELTSNKDSSQLPGEVRFTTTMTIDYE